jgi:MoxR-like ATPase
VLTAPTIGLTGTNLLGRRRIGRIEPPAACATGNAASKFVCMTPTQPGGHGLFRAELLRTLYLLHALLRRQRERGRTPAADAVGGVVIEEGEAEGLVAELAADWGRPAADLRPACVRAAHPAPADGPASASPLCQAARAFDLRPEEYDALLLALAVEVDARFGRLVAYLNDHVSHTRPTVGLALAAAGTGGAPPSPVAFCGRPVVKDGLLELEGEGPLPGLALRVPRDLLPRLTADAPPGPDGPGLRHFPPEPGLMGRLVLGAEVRDRLLAWAGPLRGGRPARPLLLCGPPGSGRTTAARAAVSLAGHPLVALRLAGEPPAERLRVGRREARWCGGTLLVDLEGLPAGLDPGALWAELGGLSHPPVLALPAQAVEAVAASAPVEPAVIELAAPDLGARARLWRALLPPGEPVEDEVLEALAGRFQFTPGRVARAARRAAAEASLQPEGRRRLTPEALERACRAVGSAAMGPLAQKLPLPYRRADLVVPDAINAELDLAAAWVRCRRRVLDEWGFGRRVTLGRGLTALFAGPPGTGKTMAAQVLAAELGLDLYRVDLSRVMDKYIGETEKHLARLFDEAQASGCLLFFDEADALFGKRSEVQDAHDRYANVEIGYLLQRMEEHDGVAVLATNRMRDLDEAFVRRFQVLVDFPMPGEAERLRIWQGTFPPQAEREPDLGLARLARDFEVSGGEIRNAVLAAAYLAASEGRPVGLVHLRRGLRRELLKSGRVVDERDPQARSVD